MNIQPKLSFKGYEHNFIPPLKGEDQAYIDYVLKDENPADIKFAHDALSTAKKEFVDNKELYNDKVFINIEKEKPNKPAKISANYTICRWPTVIDKEMEKPVPLKQAGKVLEFIRNQMKFETPITRNENPFADI